MINNIADTDVLILCGGPGKRLKEITVKVPKPMANIGNRPFLDLIIEELAQSGFRRIILGLGYKADIIKNYYSRRRSPDLKFVFSCENKPLDTGGAVKHARRFIKSDTFLVLNGDSWCKFEPKAFLKFHKKNKSLISILLRRVANGREYGEIKLDRHFRIRGFREKNASARNCLINAGVYIFDRKVFGMMPRESRFSLEWDFFPAQVSSRIFGYPVSGFFIDIGTPERYLKAKKIFLKKKYNHG